MYLGEACQTKRETSVMIKRVGLGVRARIKSRLCHLGNMRLCTETLLFLVSS